MTLPQSITSDPEVNDFPRLTRFYGLSFNDLITMPRWARRLYVSALDPLEAEEQLVAMQVADYPKMTERGRKDTHRDTMRRIRRAAGAEEPRAPAITDPLADRQKLAGIGISVVVESASEKAAARAAKTEGVE